MLDLLEALMIICFGLSWPLSVYRSYKSRTTKGKSLFFEVFVCVGYGFGITRKVLQLTGAAPGGLNFLFYLGGAFYVINLLEILLDIGLYFRNARLDRLRERDETAVLDA